MFDAQKQCCSFINLHGVANDCNISQRHTVHTVCTFLTVQDCHRAAGLIMECTPTSTTT